MGSDLYAEHLRTEVDAALRGIESALDETALTDPRFVSLVLETFGDAIRFGIETPKPIRAWCRQLAEEQLTSALERARLEAAGWKVPSSGTADVDSEVGFDLQRRDQTESALRAIGWLCLDRGAAPADLAGWRECTESLRRVDERLGSVYDRGAVEALLGPRVRLLGDRDWTSRLEDRGAAEQVVEGKLEAVSPVRRPSDAAIEQYIAEGINQRLVEGHAARDAEFAEDLVALIDTFKEMRQDVGIAAWRWQKDKQKRGPSAQTFRLPVEARRFASAASDGAAVGRERRELGRLPGLSADASLEIDDESITFHVFAQTRLAEIRIGDSKSTSPMTDGETAIWQISTGIRRGPIQIFVRSEDGQVFADEIELIPE